jgi:hypothetical protein
MDMTLVYGLVAAFAVSVVSLIGVVALVSKRFPSDQRHPFLPQLGRRRHGRQRSLSLDS